MGMWDESEEDDVDFEVDDAMEISSEDESLVDSDEDEILSEEIYGYSEEDDVDFEVDTAAESSSEDESAVESDEDEIAWEENVREVPVVEIEAVTEVEENVHEVPVVEIEAVTEVEENEMEVPVEAIDCSLTWDTPPVENDVGDGETSVNVAWEDNGVDSEGENPAERNDYEISMAAGEIVEYPVRHDVYYDSGEDGREERKARQRVKKFTPRYDGILFIGQEFFNGLAFKEAVLHHALKQQRDIRQWRYDKRKISFVCLGKGKEGINCKWRVYCSVRKGSSSWRIRKLPAEHICEKSGDCSLLKVTAIARLFVDKIRDAPDHFMPMVIEDLISERWGISVTRNQTQAARGKALKWIEAEFDDQFKRLRDYGAEILHSNPGSSVAVQSYKNSEGEEVFLRFYVCFDVLRKSWKATCRPLIGIDGTFLKSKVKGQLLVALGRDGNNQIYPVAWGVVEKENTDNWEWFVKKLQKDLGFGDDSGFVMVSDRQKGLISAVKKVLPAIEHRHCVRHIYCNIKGKFGKLDPMKKFVWDLAWSYNEAEYNERLEDLRKFDRRVYTYVVKSDPTSWCRAFYKLGPCCEDVENNSTESFNRTVAKARERAFVPMLEMIRTQAMSRIAKRKEQSERHESILTEYALEQLAQEEELAKECKIKSSTSGTFQASLSGCTYSVNLVDKICTCRKWQIKGIPCEHAYGVILKRNLRVADYVHKWFHTVTWMKTYEEGIKVPRGARFWPRGSHPPLHYPPNSVKMGCKEKKRKRGKNESPTKKKDPTEKRKNQCKACGKTGHNSRFHKEIKGNDGKGSEKRSKVDVPEDVSKGSKQNREDKETAKQKARKGKVKRTTKKAKGNDKKKKA